MIILVCRKYLEAISIEIEPFYQLNVSTLPLHQTIDKLTNFNDTKISVHKNICRGLLLLVCGKKKNPLTRSKNLFQVTLGTEFSVPLRRIFHLDEFHLGDFCYIEL